MVSTLDIFGLTLGLAYTVLAPIAAYFLLRNFAPLRARDIALGVFGFVIIVFLTRTPVDYVALALAERIFAEGRSHGQTFVSFLFGFCISAAFALQNEAACFLLLKFFASRRDGPGPGFAYAIGAGGAYCLVLANGELNDLRWALTANEFGAVSHAYAFAYGIPRGAGAVYRLLIEVVLASLVWRAILERKWRLIGAAALLDIGLAALLSLLLALVPFTGYITYESLFGLVVALSYFWAPPVLRLRARLARFREDRIAVEDDGSVRRGLLSTWRDQRWRND
jgi:uncharacterized membrane protein YhfC